MSEENSRFKKLARCKRKRSWADNDDYNPGDDSHLSQVVGCFGCFLKRLACKIQCGTTTCTLHQSSSSSPSPPSPSLAPLQTKPFQTFSATLNDAPADAATNPAEDDDSKRKKVRQRATAAKKKAAPASASSRARSKVERPSAKRRRKEVSPPLLPPSPTAGDASDCQEKLVAAAVNGADGVAVRPVAVQKNGSLGVINSNE